MPGELTPRALKTSSDTNTSAPPHRAPPLFIPTVHTWGQLGRRSLNFPEPQSGPTRHLRAAAAPPARPLGPLGPLPDRYLAVTPGRARRRSAECHVRTRARAAAALPPPHHRERARPRRLRMRSARRGARPAAGGWGAVRGLQRGRGCGSALSRCTGTRFLSKRRQALKMQALFLTCAFKAPACGNTYARVYRRRTMPPEYAE